MSIWDVAKTAGDFYTEGKKQKQRVPKRKRSSRRNMGVVLVSVGGVARGLSVASIATTAMTQTGLPIATAGKRHTV